MSNFKFTVEFEIEGDELEAREVIWWLDVSIRDEMSKDLCETTGIDEIDVCLTQIEYENV